MRDYGREVQYYVPYTLYIIQYIPIIGSGFLATGANGFVGAGVAFVGGARVELSAVLAVGLVTLWEEEAVLAGAALEAVAVAGVSCMSSFAVKKSALLVKRDSFSGPSPFFTRFSTTAVSIFCLMSVASACRRRLVFSGSWPAQTFADRV